MVKEIVIAKLRKNIKKKEERRIIFLIKSITSNKDSIKLVMSESQDLGLREIKFEVDYQDNKKIIDFIFLFLEFLQEKEYQRPEGTGWHTIKCGDYLLSLYDGGQSIAFDF